MSQIRWTAWTHPKNNHRSLEFSEFGPDDLQKRHAGVQKIKNHRQTMKKTGTQRNFEFLIRKSASHHKLKQHGLQKAMVTTAITAIPAIKPSTPTAMTAEQTPSWEEDEQTPKLRCQGANIQFETKTNKYSNWSGPTKNRETKTETAKHSNRSKGAQPETETKNYQTETKTDKLPNCERNY